MKTLKASDLLRFPIEPFLFGVLFSRIMPPLDREAEPQRFWIYTAFKTSKAVPSYDFAKYSTELIEQYNRVSGYPNWEVHNAGKSSLELRLYVENDLNINSSIFYTQVYRKLLQSDWLIDENLNASKKAFIRGYMETRGSVDLTMRLFAQDYFYNNSFELKRVQFLTDMIGLPMSYANFNPRNMQPQFVSGENKRNAQFRINLFYYAKEIGFINKYKVQVFQNAYHSQIKDVMTIDGVTYFDVPVADGNFDATFIKYLQFFTNNLYSKELTSARLNALRNQLGFNKQTNDTKQNRNKTINEIFDNIAEDKCVLCGTTKTYEKKNGRQGFEIHHVIPVYNGREYDNIGNLVKLCETCHGGLKKGRATKEEQVKMIIKLLHQNSQVFEYASAALGYTDIYELAEQIFEMLG